ncbi:MAG: TRAP transporter substrate-binding protein [Candidatus Accumulibacter sp.]|jgi:tripartite ATP-independent transporter DctP family solute receptor|nr:TRAP transporter substrate-binding protein [Accumulibacter sp.]
MKRRILLLSTLAMLGAATLPAYAADKIVVKIAGMKPDGEPETVGMKLFAKYVMEATNGKYDVQVYPNSQLGKEDAYIAQTRKGIIQMCATGTQTSAIWPAMAMLETPMLYDSMEHAHKAMNGETFKLINQGFAEKSGMTLMNAFPLGFRHFYTKNPVNSINDLKGLRMRVPNIPLYLEFAKQLGQSGQPMPFAEVPAAIDQGTIEGGDSPLADIVGVKMYEKIKNITLSGHILVIHGLYINNDFYAKLPPEDKKIFDDAAYRSAEDVWKMAAEVEKKAIKEITDGGGKIVDPNPEFKAALKKAGEGTWELFYKTVPNAKEILDSVNQYK